MKLVLRPTFGLAAICLLSIGCSSPLGLPASRDAKPESASPEPESKREESKEGGTGTRAKGEEGAHGARDFGMVGLLQGVSPGGGGQGYGAGSGRLGGAHHAGGARYAVRGPSAAPNTEAYASTPKSEFENVTDSPLSTFSVDVDTASYSNARRFLREGTLPPKDSIRVEEWLNYFEYQDPEPTGELPLSVTSEVTEAPWNRAHRLVRLGLRTRAVESSRVPPRNLVFLVDVSGSMQGADRLPLVKAGLRALVETLRPEDSIAIVVYAGASGLVLPRTPGTERQRIVEALSELEAGGPTNGAEGITLAYAEATRAFRKGGINRVILATDGDFNVGTTSEGELVRLVEEKRKTGVFLTVLGFGRGNLKDSTMEQLADKGNGNYAYVDSPLEAKRVLVEQGGATLVTVAKDVKLQVEFNPRLVQSYRLIGYDNRLLAAQDFDDDQKDAGEVGAGHHVTALYEIVPPGAPNPARAATALAYQTTPSPSAASASDELCTVHVRFKRPDSPESRKFHVVVRDGHVPLADASTDARFAIAVAEAAEILQGSERGSRRALAEVRALAAAAVGSDQSGDRRAFLTLLDRAHVLRTAKEQPEPL